VKWQWSLRKYSFDKVTSSSKKTAAQLRGNIKAVQWTMAARMSPPGYPQQTYQETKRFITGASKKPGESR